MKSGTGMAKPTVQREKATPAPFTGTFIHYSVEWHLGRLHSVAVVTSATIDMDEQVAVLL